jgi:transcription termination/antitermination protein NusG
MTSVTAREVQWFAVRMKPNASGGPRTAIVDVEKEQYINRAGQKSWRKVKGTGNRVFLPEHLMKRAGFEVFLPVKKVLRIKNRFTKEKHLVSVPLLADWLFVGLPIVETEYGRGVPAWKKLMELDVVAGVMGTGGKPIQMSDATVMRLMRQFSSGRVPSEVKRRVAARRVFGVGDVAKVVHGPFEDFDFRIVEVGDSSAKGVLNLFGRDNLMELGLENLSTK